MSGLTIVIDNRERAVFEGFIDVPDVTTAQMTVGDYAIISDDCIHEIFERKTLKDYADSIRDGRHENRRKMLSLRDECECRVYYIIEGSLHDAPSVIGGIPKSTIESSIFNLMSNHNIFVLFSKDQLDTARLLIAKRTALGNSLKNKKLTYPCHVESPIGRLTEAPKVTLNQILIEAIESYKGIGPKLAIEIAKMTTLGEIIVNPGGFPKSIAVSGRRVKVAFPISMTERLKALRCLPRAGKLDELLEAIDDEDKTLEEIFAAIDDTCTPKKGLRLKKLLTHKYDAE